MRKLIYCLFLCLLIAGESWGSVGKSASFMVTAKTNDDGSITFSWNKGDPSWSYYIYRKSDPIAVSWGSGTVAVLDSSAVSWTDKNVHKGEACEYQFIPALGNKAISNVYLYAGNKFPGFVYMGKVILMIDSTLIEPLSSEIETLVNDMTGEGWDVITSYAGRGETDVQVKSRIKQIYDDNNGNIRTLFILGHVPVPYSGTFSGQASHWTPPDGHIENNGNHTGAWPADVFYGVFNGVWTDTDSLTTGGDTRNHNLPGDGKWDQSKLPANVQLEIGRVDLSNLPEFNDNEIELTRKYLNRDHKFRTGQWKSIEHCLIDDNFTGLNLSATGYRNFSAFFPQDSIFDDRDYFTEQRTTPYLWSYGCGPGSYTSCGGIGNSSDFVTDTFQNVFTMLAGSFFGDWDVTNSFLRSPLGAGSLISFWGGIPEWYLHHLAMGMNFGFAAKITQNNKYLATFSTGYNTVGGDLNGSYNSVHVALMGDPTLKMKYIQPPSDFAGTSTLNSVNFSWLPSQDNVDGYMLYAVNETAGISSPSYVSVSSEIILTNKFSGHIKLPTGTYKFALRAIKLDSTASGSSFIMSNGLFKTLNYVNNVNEELSDNITLSAYPSISSDFVIVEANLSGIMSVTDITGQKILEKPFFNDTKLDIRNFAAGMYFVTIKDNKGNIKSCKIIKK